MKNGAAAIDEAIEAIKAAEEPKPAPVPYVAQVTVEEMRARINRAMQLGSQEVGDPASLMLAVMLANSQRNNAQMMRTLAETEQYLQARAAELAPDAPGAMPGSMLPRKEGEG